MSNYVYHYIWIMLVSYCGLYSFEMNEAGRVLLTIMVALTVSHVLMLE
eukprot:gene18054-21503_t